MSWHRPHSGWAWRLQLAFSVNTSTDLSGGGHVSHVDPVQLTIVTVTLTVPVMFLGVYSSVSWLIKPGPCKFTLPSALCIPPADTGLGVSHTAACVDAIRPCRAAVDQVLVVLAFCGRVFCFLPSGPHSSAPLPHFFSSFFFSNTCPSPPPSEVNPEEF